MTRLDGRLQRLEEYPPALREWLDYRREAIISREQQTCLIPLLWCFGARDHFGYVGI